MPQFPLLAGKLSAIFLVSVWGALHHCPVSLEYAGVIQTHDILAAVIGLLAADDAMPNSALQRLSGGLEGLVEKTGQTLMHHVRGRVLSVRFFKLSDDEGRGVISERQLLFVDLKERPVRGKHFALILFDLFRFRGKGCKVSALTSSAVSSDALV
ncbi:hypothetical protein BPNPMPFG_007871 (plasmid) [Mesorhizobium sp. AR07]|uniref:hypothetical protein n=1 Tax=Mesorhizobium sp. AR07 TaxID=2865838 RepID=UPI002160D390|nr:hypothetical protein [Mesorhizobium sp. AR07]UVK48489.1 hypothetical protein BPNPMPFG_007871 [Mesorhizobium sp. AR07]